MSLPGGYLVHDLDSWHNKTNVHPSAFNPICKMCPQSTLSVDIWNYCLCTCHPATHSIQCDCPVSTWKASMKNEAHLELLPVYMPAAGKTPPSNCRPSHLTSFLFLSQYLPSTLNLYRTSNGLHHQSTRANEGVNLIYSLATILHAGPLC